MADPKVPVVRPKRIGSSPPGAPDPGYDSPPRTPEKVEFVAEVYPKPFITSLKGQGTQNVNARRLLDKSKKYE